MSIDLLTDTITGGHFATLVNCEVRDDRVLCGFAFFRGGISGTLEVAAKGQEPIEVILPDSLKKIRTHTAFTDPNDKYELKRPPSETHETEL